jgi:hypothetical protein
MTFRRRTSETIAGLQRELEAMRSEMAAKPLPAPPASPVTSLEPPSPGTSLTEIHDLVRGLAKRVDGVDRRQLEDHERLRLRLEELTAQFTNQLTEMGHELDAAHRQLSSELAAQAQRFDALGSAAGNGDGARPSAVLDELRTNQVKIANDLARHEIALRQDLAALADLVNRSRTGRGVSPGP